MKRTTEKKWISLLLCFVMALTMIPGGILTAHAEDGVAIDETNFPDEYFRTYVAENFDWDGDGFLSEDERESVFYISLNSTFPLPNGTPEFCITSFRGVEYFTNLEELYCTNNQLTELDVSGLAKLEKLECFSNQLTELNVSGCVSLKELDCFANQLTELDLTGCPALEKLACDENLLTVLDISACRNLITAYTEGTLTEYATVNNYCYEYMAQLWGYNYKDSYSLIVDAAVEVITSHAAGVAINEVNFPDEVFRAYVAERFDADGDGFLSDVEIGSAKVIGIYSPDLTSLQGVEFLTALETLNYTSSRLTELDVSHNTALKLLLCGEGGLTELDVSGCPALETLWCSNNSLNTLDVSANTGLVFLSCQENQLTELDVSHNTALTSLSCYSNALTALNLGSNASLEFLNCRSNLLTELDISGCPCLIQAYLGTGSSDYRLYADETTMIIAGQSEGDVAISRINFPDNRFRTFVSEHYDRNNNGFLSKGEISLVSYMYVDGLSIQSLKGVEYFTNLTELFCYDNQLTELDVSQNTALRWLHCNFNLLTELNVGHNMSLKKLWCSGNQLNGLDVSGCPALEDLHCGQNRLTELDVSANTALTGLYCNFNQLTELDVSANTALTELYCNSNQLTELDVSANTALKNLNCSVNQLTELNISACPTLLDAFFCGTIIDYGDWVAHKMADGLTILSVDKTTQVITAPPVIVSQPGNVKTLEGLLAVFSVEADGQGQLTYAWWCRKTGGDWTPVSGGSSAVLRVTATADLNDALFRCVVSNAAGEVVSETATLAVRSMPQPLPGSGRAHRIDPIHIKPVIGPIPVPAPPRP